MLDWFGAEENSEEWVRDGNQWVCHRDGRKLVIERVGFLFRSWKFYVIEKEGEAATLDEAMARATRATERVPTVLRMLKGGR